MNGWQVWFTDGANGYGPIPECPAFGGQIFTSRAKASSAWYDTIPGVNDHACYVRIVDGKPQHVNLP